MNTKLALGTVQFGLDYGISNTKGKVDLREVESIFDFSNKVGIDTVDTAKAYGDSEEKIGGINLDNFKIISKLINLENIEVDINDSLTKLNISELYAILVHDFNAFKKNKDLYIKLLQHKNKTVRKVGFSLNKTSELDFLLKNKIEFDIVQVPYNILDQRFEKHFKILKEIGVEIHTRSAFLQGVFFLNKEDIPSKIKSIYPYVEAIKNISIENEINMETLALNFVAQNEYINKVVVGVTSCNELKKNINSIKTGISEEIYHQLLKLKVDDENIILPMNWN